MSAFDLHIHSNYSLDGQYSPKELIDLCEIAGLKIISITDHNSTEAIEEACFYAKKKNIKLISGIEIDCSYKDFNMHLLGYNINFRDNIFKNLQESFYKQELMASQERIKKINQFGFNLCLNELLEFKGADIISPEDIAEYLLDKSTPYNHEILIPYLDGGNRSDNPNVNFYWDYFAKGKPCYCEIHMPSIEETISLIKNSGGIPVVAHPGITFKDNFHQVNKLISLGIEGIECFSSYHSYKDCQYFYNLAKENKLTVTLGSDFHGKNKPKVKLGESNCFLNDNLLASEQAHWHFLL
jgi:predicted metal-dependent phosphoesterase TrpH